MKVSINNCQIEVLVGDISALPKAVDALVSSDDNYLSAGGGVSLALLEAAADESVRAEMERHVGGNPDGRKESLLKAGDAVVTSAGKLRAKYLIHAVSLDFDHPLLATDEIQASEEIVERATTRCLETATELGLTSIAFPVIGSGLAELSFAESARAMCGAIGTFLTRSDSKLHDILLVAFENEARNDLQAALTEAVARLS